MSIMHERTDMAVRLREDLTVLDARGIIQAVAV